MCSKNLLISIIVPVYNAEDYIGVCIESLLCQDYKNFEIILVNDGSIDLSGDICDRYAKLNENVKVYHQENKGVSVARNLGIEKACGEWITFVDSDDFVTEHYLSSFIDLELVENKLIVQDIIHEDLNKSRSVLSSKKYGLFNLKDIDVLVSEGLIFPKRYVCSKLYNLELLRINNISFKKDIKYGEDLLFFLEYLNLVDSIFLSSEANYIYRRNEKSATYKLYSFNQYLSINGYLTDAMSALVSESKWSQNMAIKELFGMFLYLAIVSIYSEKGSSSKERIEKLSNIKQLQSFDFINQYLRTRKINSIELFFVNRIANKQYGFVDYFFPKYLTLYYGIRDFKNSIKKS